MFLSDRCDFFPLQTFGLKPGERRKLEDIGSDIIMVMRTSLSKNEFADALGMKPDSLFVKRMFNCVDKDKDGQISFQEFLDTVDLFSRGEFTLLCSYLSTHKNLTGKTCVMVPSKCSILLCGVLRWRA